ncbi:MAG: ribosome recycling factor [Gammaproteobacteria bacterium]|nr:ribosome recycling factor [Gammaproteobacteria bacterium]
MLKEIEKDAQQRMVKSEETLKHELAKIRTGRAHPSILDHIHVDYYGSNLPISQVANINVEDSRTLSVTPWEKSMVKVVEKAIITSDLGLNPAVSGSVLRIPMPALTEERRRDLIRVVKNEGEGAKVAVRNIRRDANADIKSLLKEKSVSEDEAHGAEDRVQKLTDAHIATIDSMVAIKEKELMEI